MEDVEVVGRLHQGPTFRSEIISELPNTWSIYLERKRLRFFDIPNGRTSTSCNDRKYEGTWWKVTANKRWKLVLKQVYTRSYIQWTCCHRCDGIGHTNRDCPTLIAELDNRNNNTQRERFQNNDRFRFRIPLVGKYCLPRLQLFFHKHFNC
jgi:hypothetical protein